MTSQQMTHDVIIVGAGPVGGTLACRLAAAGLRVAVTDKAPLPPMEHPDFDGRAYAIAAGSRSLLDAAGLWDALPLPAGPIEQIRVSDGKIGRPPSRLHLHFNANDLNGTGSLPEGASQTSGATASGHHALGWMVEARSLRIALNARLNTAPNLTAIAPADSTASFDPAGATLRLSTGETLRACLIIAAEGRGSALRRQAGLTAQTIPYHQSGIVCAVAHQHPHNRTALEHFLPAGPFAQLPMAPGEAGENLSAIVWTERTADAPRFMAMDNAAFGDQVARRLGPHLGWVKPVGRRWDYPLAAMYVHRFVAPRLAIVGDAAHGIHPIAGQGLNLGLRDAIALADLLIAAHARGEDLGRANLLAAYQRARRVDVIAMLAATDQLDRLFSTNNPAIRLARGLGIAAVDRMPRLKQAFMRQAMGLH
jgi:2-octaprenyl-6-methoxyphenol hydroxylase